MHSREVLGSGRIRHRLKSSLLCVHKQLHIGSLKEKGGCRHQQDNMSCCGRSQPTYVFLGISAAPKAKEWGGASVAEPKADSVPQLQGFVSPLFAVVWS